MGRLKMLKPRVLPDRVGLKPYRSRDSRQTGRKLQKERWQFWLDDPHCAKCRRLVDWPHGFELDHITALDQGGSDDRSNKQILCVGSDIRVGCHELKTKQER